MTETRKHRSLDVVKRSTEEKQGDLTKRTDGKHIGIQCSQHVDPSFVEMPLVVDGLEPTGTDLVSSSQQPIMAADRSGDRTTSHSAGERTDSFGDKSETALKRVAEKIINYDMTPVAQALAQYLGIDLTADGVQARNRRGISVIVHGPPGSGKSSDLSITRLLSIFSGKTMIARELSQHYDCALLSLDQVIIDAIDSAHRNEFAQRAYHMCRDAMEKHLDEQKQAETDADHAMPAQPGTESFRCLSLALMMRSKNKSLCHVVNI